MKVSAKQFEEQLHVKETRRKAKEFKRHNLDVQIYNKKATVKNPVKKPKVDILA
jgi:hypothetical protein